MTHIVVIGGSGTVRTMLRQKLGALVAQCAVDDAKRASWNFGWFAAPCIPYEATFLYAQMGWVNAVNKEVRVQQSRKAHQVRRDTRRRQQQPQLKKTRVKGIMIAR